MPYRSLAQDRFIHAKASEGVHWAKKFVADSHGTHVPKPDPPDKLALLKRSLGLHRKTR